MSGFDDSSPNSGQVAGRTARRAVRALEWLTAVHVATFLVAASWCFGGQAAWVRGPLTAWGLLGLPITLAALLQPRSESRETRFPLTWTLPILLFNAVVLAASANPSFREVQEGGVSYLVNDVGSQHWPSAARPELAREALWRFDAIWLACFNLGFVVQHRRTLRRLLLVAVVNALVLAIFGTAQKLVHSQGLFFGAVHSPQKYFFSTFVYHNHWGAFILLMIAATLALVSRSLRLRGDNRDFFHSPAFTGCIVLLLLVVTVPLSASRSATLLALVLLGVSGLQGLVKVVRRRRQYRESLVLPVTAVVLAVVLGAGAVWYIAGDTIRSRLSLTFNQVQYARTSRSPDARVELYRDTWSMAMDKPWFGWGMASYPHVFTIYNSRVSVDRLPVFYHDAHSDWLQSLAEHGIVGTTLILLAVALPLLGIHRGVRETPVSGYLMLGCGVVVAYAALEFPFGNYAVVLAWWFCFYAAARYAQLTAARETNAR